MPLLPNNVAINILSAAIPCAMPCIICDCQLKRQACFKKSHIFAYNSRGQASTDAACIMQQCLHLVMLGEHPHRRAACRVHVIILKVYHIKRPFQTAAQIAARSATCGSRASGMLCVGRIA